MDPDNGIGQSSLRRAEAARFALIDEVKEFTKVTSVILYQHPNRLKGFTHPKQIARWKNRLKECTGIQPLALRFRKQQPRFFFVLPADNARATIESRLQEFGGSEWVKTKFFDKPDLGTDLAEETHIHLEKPSDLQLCRTPSSERDVAAHYLADALGMFRRQKRLAEEAMAQLSDQELFLAIDSESNSVAVIVKHMAGNMSSRWTDFLKTDGEKSDRNRDQEFILDAGTARADVMRWWDDGWACVFAALEPLGPADVMHRVMIRGEPHTVMQAIQRQLDHYAYHVGQIVFLAKHLRASGWKTLSVPRGKSAEFNAEMERKQSAVSTQQSAKADSSKSVR